MGSSGHTGFLHVAADLAAVGVAESASEAVEVVPEVGGGFVFGAGLESTTESRDAPKHPDQIFGFCMGSTPPSTAAVPSFVAAREEVRAFLDAEMADRPTAAWEALAAQNDSDLLDDAAGVAFADQRYAGALAASLRAYELDPGDALHLSNAAAAANLLDRPEWAIAFATEAARAVRAVDRRAPGGSPSGEPRPRLGAQAPVRQRPGGFASGCGRGPEEPGSPGRARCGPGLPGRPGWCATAHSQVVADRRCPRPDRRRVRGRVDAPACASTAAPSSTSPKGSSRNWSSHTCPRRGGSSQAQPGPSSTAATTTSGRTRHSSSARSTSRTRSSSSRPSSGSPRRTTHQHRYDAPKASSPESVPTPTRT